MKLDNETHDLLDFALGSLCEEGGFGWLDGVGSVDRTQGRHLWINARMTHVAAIGTLLGHPGCSEALEHGVSAIDTCFRDRQYGGWYAHIDWDGNPIDDTKAQYSHAFVILAASSAVAAGSSAAVPLLEDALDISTTRFWDDSYNMVVEEWDRTFTHLADYRGVNANMHTVEAYLAAADVLDQNNTPGSGLWRERAMAIIERVVNREARGNDWRIPEHFDAAWTPDLEYNKERPADPFRPYGATIGHGLEWVRLCLQVYALDSQPAWIPEAVTKIYARAIADGWEVDGAPGFVYTTDWQGKPVVHERMHWVLAEAIGASAAMGRAGLAETQADLERWWQYADTYLIDYENGSWHHELDRTNQCSSTVWVGKPDVYHALQATLFPSLPLAPTIVPALAQGLLAQ